MTFEERANIILKDSIKSAIYVDDKSKGFYQETSIAINLIEEELSVDLYQNFKESGISLEVYKFQKGDENNSDKLNFITDNRDFVILDWKLDGESGEELSLQILKQTVEAKHVHFCTIYTSDDGLHDVKKNIISFFSDETSDYYNVVKEVVELEEYPEDVIDIFHQINLKRFSKEVRSLRGEIYKKDKNIIPRLKEITGEDDDTCAIIRSSISLMNTFKSDRKLCCPSYIDPERNIIVINNTIITILNKEKNKADTLLDNFKNHIINDFDSYNQLLGIELYNHLFRSSALTNDSIMSFSKDALVFHRKKLKEEGIGHFFKNFMDEILLEKISLSLRDRPSVLLDDELLDSFENVLDEKYNDLRAIHKMNVFYNSFYLNKNDQTINFGDIFLVEENDNHKGQKPKYLICLTALCDCLRPQEKIRSNYYFAEGKNIDIETALCLGETAFTSYLSNGVTIVWSEISMNEIQQKYSPIYIKPVQYKVFEDANTINHEGQIEVHYLDKAGQTKTEKLTYLGTIRPNYTQRIANHAFSYPIRVGVDFAKI
jgi:hypothetical protein